MTTQKNIVANGRNATKRNERKHTGLRTLDAHYSAAEVYAALHAEGEL